MRRSMLFLPGNNPNMLINGNCLGADAVIFDLEDAVAPAEKDAAFQFSRRVVGRAVEPVRAFRDALGAQADCRAKRENNSRDLSHVMYVLVSIPNLSNIPDVSQNIFQITCIMSPES